MRQIALAAVTASVMFAGSAFAADIAVKAVPLPAPVYSWTGFYLGGNFGLALERNQTQLRTFNNVGENSSSENFTGSPTGVAGGIQAGFNWQVSPRFVLGAEADIQASSQKENDCIGGCFQNSHRLISQKLPWFATVRGRAGYSTGPALFYITGGWAAARLESNALFSARPTGPDVPGSLSETKQGWTVGGGLEAQLVGNWTGKIEYLYMDLGDANSAQFPRPTNGASSGNWDFAHRSIQNHVMRMGINYKFGDPVYAAPVAAAAGLTHKAAPRTTAAPTMIWSGFYVGGNAGVLLSNNATDVTRNVSFVTDRSWNVHLGPWAGIAGGQFGFNWQVQPNWMFGLESDLQAASGPHATACFGACAPPPFDSTYSIKQRLTWFGTLRARTGYTAGLNLFYVTGGLAYGGISTELDVRDTNSGGITGSVSGSSTKVGWTVGGGLETRLAQNLTGKVEYLYLDLGTANSVATLTGPLVTGATFGTSSRIQEHVARVGLNYQFNEGAVVAKY